jgi:hypothetical protein
MKISPWLIGLGILGIGMVFLAQRQPSAAEPYQGRSPYDPGYPDEPEPFGLGPIPGEPAPPWQPAWEGEEHWRLP